MIGNSIVYIEWKSVTHDIILLSHNFYTIYFHIWERIFHTIEASLGGYLHRIVSCYKDFIKIYFDQITIYDSLNEPIKYKTKI